MYGRFRGSPRRLRRLRFRDNWTPEMWFVLVGLVVVAVLVLSGVMKHPEH